MPDIAIAGQIGHQIMNRRQGVVDHMRTWLFTPLLRCAFRPRARRYCRGAEETFPLKSFVQVLREDVCASAGHLALVSVTPLVAIRLVVAVALAWNKSWYRARPEPARGSLVPVPEVV